MEGRWEREKESESAHIRIVEGIQNRNNTMYIITAGIRREPTSVAKLRIQVVAALGSRKCRY